jgi:two-component system, sensor histidine kinase and response regulator
MNDFLSKPFMPQDLYEIVEKWVPDTEGTSRSEHTGKGGHMSDADGTPPVDIEGFRAMMREVGIEEIVDTTLEVYASEAPSVIQRLEDAIAAQDADGVRSAAHSLKSSSGNIRSDRFAAMLEELEQLGRNGKTSEATAYYTALRAEYDAVMAYLAAQQAR